MSDLYIVLIPLFPLLATIILVLAGYWLGEAGRKVGTFAIGMSFGLSVVAFVELAVWHQPISLPLYQLLRSGRLAVEVGLYVDQLTVLLLLLVTGVSFVVHAYSSRYMIGDARHCRFFALMALFTFAMVTLVMSSNLLMIFMCWELMGICSYLLISHQAERKAACHAATKAFLVNALADVGLLFAIILTFATFGTLEIRQILDQAASASGQTINLFGWAGFEYPVQTITMISFFLFVGCLGKSAQIPFHVWLPQAMEAPTPVSALIHAATMVNAGPFLLVRFSALVMLSPAVMTLIAIIGGTTALFAAAVSLTQTDIKRILAYSTISQIGFMIMTCGVGAFVAAVFHLLAHGILKGYLFLSTGNQLESAAAHAHQQSAAGQSRPSWLLYFGALVLACVPPFVMFSGFYEHLWTAQNSNAASMAFWVIGLLTVFVTAMYCVRGVTSLFQHSPSELVQPQLFSPSHVLGISAAALGMVGFLMVLWGWFVPFLMPALGGPYPAVADAWQPASSIPRFVLPLLAAFLGWLLACLLYTKPKLFSVAHSGFGKSMYVLFLNKFYFDEIYSLYIIQPTLRTAKWLWRIVDVSVIDRVVVQFGRHAIVAASWLWQTSDVCGIERAAERAGGQSVALGQWLWTFIEVRRIGKTSQQIDGTTSFTDHDLQEFSPRALQHQLLVLILWLVVAIAFFYWLVL